MIPKHYLASLRVIALSRALKCDINIFGKAAPKVKK